MSDIYSSHFKTSAKVWKWVGTCKSEPRRTCVGGWSKIGKNCVDFKFSLTFVIRANVKECKQKPREARPKILAYLT